MIIEEEAACALPAYPDPYFPGPKGFVLTLSCFLKIFDKIFSILPEISL